MLYILQICSTHLCYIFPLTGALLSPDNPLNRDVRDLAGILDFGNEEIHYICTKDFPFKYMLDQWCKRVGDEATMENLKVALQELKRPDAVEVVEEAKKGWFQFLISLVFVE